MAATAEPPSPLPVGALSVIQHVVAPVVGLVVGYICLLVESHSRKVSDE